MSPEPFVIYASDEERHEMGGQSSLTLKGSLIYIETVMPGIIVLENTFKFATIMVAVAAAFPWLTST